MRVKLFAHMYCAYSCSCVWSRTLRILCGIFFCPIFKVILETCVSFFAHMHCAQLCACVWNRTLRIFRNEFQYKNFSLLTEDSYLPHTLLHPLLDVSHYGGLSTELPWSLMLILVPHWPISPPSRFSIFKFFLLGRNNNRCVSSCLRTCTVLILVLLFTIR